MVLVNKGNFKCNVCCISMNVYMVRLIKYCHNNNYYYYVIIKLLCFIKIKYFKGNVRHDFVLHNNVIQYNILNKVYRTDSPSVF